MKNAKALMGLVVLVLVLVLGGWLYLWAKDNPDAKEPTAPSRVTITCAGGSEKTELMADPEVKKLLEDKFGLVVNFVPMGSYKQVLLSSDDIKARGYHCLWPSSASARSVFESKHAGAFPGYRAANVLQSPEVIYSGPTATAALQRAGLVTTSGEAHLLDIEKLLTQHVLKNTTWQQLKAGDLAGPVRIRSTDARTSNSGFTLAQLQLTVMATDDANPPTLAEAKTVLPTMRRLYETSGLQAASSDDGFRQWLTQGGEYSAPLYAGYENQLLQQWVKSGRDESLVKDVTMLYPSPTIYSDHPILALDADGARLVEAMQDTEIQTIAWKKYGFRSTVNAGLNVLSDFQGMPLAARFRTIPAPNSEVTLAMLDCLEDAGKCS